jgi:hypothetical protein
MLVYPQGDLIRSAGWRGDKHALDNLRPTPLYFYTLTVVARSHHQHGRPPLEK